MNRALSIALTLVLMALVAETAIKKEESLLAKLMNELK